MGRGIAFQMFIAEIKRHYFFQGGYNVGLDGRISPFIDRQSGGSMRRIEKAYTFGY